MSVVLVCGNDEHAPGGFGHPTHGHNSFTASPNLGTPDAIIAAYNVTMLLKAHAASAVGGGNYGQRCDGQFTKIQAALIATKLPGIVLQVAMREGHGLAICEVAGRRVIVTWGGNGYGTLGNGTSGFGDANHALNSAIAVYPKPPVFGVEPVQVAAGERHVAALLADGRVLRWGWDRQGADGTGDAAEHLTPVLTVSPVRFVAIAEGSQHGLSLDAQGGVWAHGWGHMGQLGLGDLLNRFIPTKIGLPRPAIAVAAGGDRSYAILDNHELWWWGQRTEVTSKLVEGKTVPVFNPKPSAHPAKLMSNVRAIAAGTEHTLIIDTNSEVHAYEHNAFGELGLGTRTPFEQVPKPTGVKARAVAAGFQASLALT